MTGVEKIVQQIQDDAQQAAQAALARARDEARQIMEQVRGETDAQVAAIEAQSAAAVAAAHESAKSAAALARRRAVLEAKQEIISSAIAEAQKAACALPEQEYFALILKMIGKYSLPLDGEILFNPADKKRLPDSFADALAKQAKGTLRISDETRGIDGGFVLVYGGIEENCSFAALIDAARETLQDQVQALLFA